MKTIKSLREQKKITQKDLALKLSIPVKKIKDWEESNDLNKCYASELFLISTFFNVSPEEIIHAHDYKKMENRMEKKALKTNYDLFKEVMGREAIDDNQAVKFTKEYLNLIEKY